MSNNVQNSVKETRAVVLTITFSIATIASLAALLHIADQSTNSVTTTVSQPTQPTQKTEPNQAVVTDATQPLTEEERKRQLAQELIRLQQERYRRSYELSQRNPKAYRAQLEQTRRNNLDSDRRRAAEDDIINSSFDN